MLMIRYCPEEHLVALCFLSLLQLLLAPLLPFHKHWLHAEMERTVAVGPLLQTQSCTLISGALSRVYQTIIPSSSPSVTTYSCVYTVVLYEQE